jgi:tetratricopeptide (TPR) repeat protein
MAELLAGRPASALKALGRCMAADPDYAPLWSLLAGIHVRQGRYARARREIDRALALRPGHVGDLHNRAVAATALGEYDRAIEDYEAVLRREPDSAGTHNNLAWVLATARDPRIRDGRRALGHARNAVRSARAPAWLDTLAAALAECGNFDRAVAVEREAYRRSRPPNERFRRRIEIYRQRRTIAEWREAHDGVGG